MKNLAYCQVYESEDPILIGTTLLEPINYPEQLVEGDTTVYLFGDWEINPTWPAIQSRLRSLANKYVIKMFVASDSAQV
mgnify:FL=1